MIARHQAGEASRALAGDAPDATTSATLLARPRWIDRDAFLDQVLRDLAPDTTDDEPIP